MEGLGFLAGLMGLFADGVAGESHKESRGAGGFLALEMLSLCFAWCDNSKHGSIYGAKTGLSAVVWGTPLGIPLMHVSSPGVFLLPLVWLSEQRPDLGGSTGRLHSVLRMVTTSWLCLSLHSCGAQRFGQEP